MGVENYQGVQKQEEINRLKWDISTSASYFSRSKTVNVESQLPGGWLGRNDTSQRHLYRWTTNMNLRNENRCASHR